MPVVAIPKTMDNDVHGTDYCIGFSTAVTRTVNFVHQLRTSAGSHERLTVVEVFGRYSGETSLVSAYLVRRRPGRDQRGAVRRRPARRAAAARQAGEPQQLRDDDDLRGRDRRSAARWSRAARRTRTGTASSAGSASSPAELLKERTGQDMIYQQLGYLMRSGIAGLARPHGGDQLRRDGRPTSSIEGTSGRLVALRDGNYANVPLDGRRAGRRSASTSRRCTTRSEYRPKIRHVDGKPMFLY